MINELRWMGTPSEIAPLSFLFLSFLLKRDKSLKERICSSRSKFFPLRVDLELPRYSGKLTGSQIPCTEERAWCKHILYFFFRKFMFFVNKTSVLDIRISW